MSPALPTVGTGMTTGQIDWRYGDASATAPSWDVVERLLADA